MSISTHGLEEAWPRRKAGADAVTLSPIFVSASKPGYGPALGLERLGEVAAVSPVPVIALGGIEDEAGVRACLEAGAAAVAVMGAVMRAADPAGLLARLVRATGTGEQPRLLPSVADDAPACFAKRKTRMVRLRRARARPLPYPLQRVLRAEASRCRSAAPAPAFREGSPRDS